MRAKSSSDREPLLLELQRSLEIALGLFQVELGFFQGQELHRLRFLPRLGLRLRIQELQAADEERQGQERPEGGFHSDFSLRAAPKGRSARLMFRVSRLIPRTLSRSEFERL